jgi:hypothetical protein
MDRLPEAERKAEAAVKADRKSLQAQSALRNKVVLGAKLSLPF